MAKFQPHVLINFVLTIKKECKCLYLITISKRIDSEMSFWRNLYIMSYIFIFSWIFPSFLLSDMFFMLLETELKVQNPFNWQIMLYGDPHFKLLPFVNKFSYKFLLGLDLKNFQRSFKWSLRMSLSKASKIAMSVFFWS